MTRPGVRCRRAGPIRSETAQPWGTLPGRMATKKKVSNDPRIAEALARHGFPHGPGAGLGFTAEDDALFARGYPQLRIVEDVPDDPTTRTARVEDALDAIDPVLRVRVPEAFAAAYLRGYRVGPLLFVDRNHPSPNAEKRAARREAVASSAPITEALLRETLREGTVAMGRDTYARWRLPEVLHLYEHFLGSDVVARAAVDRLVELGTEDLGSWGFAGDPDRTNAAGHELAKALPWILLRARPEQAAELRARLASVTPKKQGNVDPVAFFALLDAVAHPERTDLPPAIAMLAVPLALAHGHVGVLREALAKQPRHLLTGSMPGRFVWLLGSQVLAGELPFHGMPPLPLLDSLAPLRDPGVVRAIAHLGAGRAASAAAAAWLAAHADYARPILETLAGLDLPKEAKVARTALGLLGGTLPPPPAQSAAELEAEIAAIFARLGDALRRSADREAQIAHLREAHEAYTEARAAVGDPTPEAYFTHRFGDFGLGEWAMLAVDAI